MLVAPERLLPAVLHLHRTSGGEGQHAGVYLEVDVLARPEGSAHGAKSDADLLLRHAEARRELVEIDVEPLRVHVQVHAAVLGREGQAGLRPERGVVLHGGLVVSLHPHLGLRVGVPVLDVHVAEHVAEGVQLRRVGLERLLHVDEGGKDLVPHADELRSTPRGLAVGRGDDGHRLPLEPDDVGGEHRLVVELEAEGRLAGDGFRGEHRANAGNGEGGPRIDREDPGRRERAPRRGAVEHALRPQVAGVLECTGGLGDAVHARHGLAHPTDEPLGGDGGAHARLPTAAPRPAIRRPKRWPSAAMASSPALTRRPSPTTGRPCTTGAGTRAASSTRTFGFTGRSLLTFWPHS